MKGLIAALRIDGPEADQDAPLTPAMRQVAAEIVRMKCRDLLLDHRSPSNAVFALDAAGLLKRNASPELARLRTAARRWRLLAILAGVLGGGAWFILGMLAVLVWVGK